ncbi:hypothetical protein F511_43047 [Dorcoceras hygrometricum]|uniref:Delphilin-like n=1 Tax=Dorcoceras hygrometricum TaxID=472368 RepID=A0A2Z7CB82_9LAMI|nr:hypothetical protein F511_43047 [Dorcoceras hygrometricum]
MAEERTMSWADTDSESSFSSSSSSDSEQEEVHCLMADKTSDDEERSVNRYLLYTIDAYLLTDSVPSPKSCFRHSLHSTSTTMASVFIVNSYQINFESVLMIPDHDGMLNMFKALEANGLRGFLGCESVLYEKELEQLFDTTLVQGDDITGAISGKYFSISQARFAKIFELPTEGLVNFSEVPKDRVYDARSIFSQKGVQVEIHGKKKYMKYEFWLLNDILAKAVNVKAGSFDAVTTEWFQMMTAIHFGLKVNWSKVLFNVLKDMMDKSQKKAKGFAAQLGVLLKSMPAITMGDGVPFPNAKILSMKTVNTYIATNITIDARGENVEPGLAKVAVVKRTPKSKKKSSSTDETPVEVISEIAGLIQSARLEGKNNDDLLILRLNELKKTVMAQGVTTATDSLAFKSRFNALDAKLLLLDGQVAAIRSEQLEFQAKIAADLLSLSTQIGDLVDYIRGDDAKKGEGSSSRPQPTPDDQGRGGGDTGGGSGGVRTTTIVDRLSLEEVAERIREADRQRSNVDLERERNREIRERRLSRSGPSKRRRY